MFGVSPAFLHKSSTGGKSPVVIILTDTSLTTWLVPSDWNNNNNKIECLGGGAGGHFSWGGCGQGGYYSSVSNLTLTPGNSVNCNVGAAGAGIQASTGYAGGDTWFVSTTTVLAPGGNSSTPAVGTIKFVGGGASGGVSGGGGAAGPHGNGLDGANNRNGGQGGNADNGIGGIGGTATVLPTTGSEWGAGYGSGGGGAQNGGSVAQNSGALYGGGGGAASGLNGNGAQGLIVITYTPA